MRSVRVLIGCSLGGQGHLIPLVNVGRAIERAGHQTLFLVPPALEQSARETGLPFRVGDEPPRAFVEEIWQRVRAGPADAVAGLIDRELFAERCTQSMLRTARELRDRWQPDFVLREPCEYASAIAAHEAGIPHAQVGISPAEIEFGVHAMVASIIEEFAPGVAAATGSAPYLSAFPASLDPSRWPDTRRFRHQAARVDLKRPIPTPQPPLVYITFGTVLGHLGEATDAYRAALEAVAGLPVRALLTTGQATEASALGTLPDNTRVEQWVAQDDVLPEAAVVVCHGGSGTTLGALSAGVPVVICPLFADNAHNGQTVQDAGAGVVVRSRAVPAGGLRTLEPEDMDVLRDAIQKVLGEPAYEQAAARIAAEMAAMPSVDDVVSGLLRR